MGSGIGITGKQNGINSLNNVKGFALDAMNTDVFKKTESLLADDIADFISETIRVVPSVAEDKVQEFAGVITRFTKKNPLYLAAGLLTLSLICGAYLTRKRR